MPTYLDSSGRSLVDYPRPSVAVDTAALTVPPGGALVVLLVRSGDTWRLPGTFLHEGETLAEAVLRSLRDKVGVTGLSPQQLHVYDDPTRDERGWVLSVAHVDAVPPDRLIPDAKRARLTDVDALPPLPYGHEHVIERAVGCSARAVRVGTRPGRFAHVALHPPGSPGSARICCGGRLAEGQFPTGYGGCVASDGSECDRLTREARSVVRRRSDEQIRSGRQVAREPVHVGGEQSRVTSMPIHPPPTG